MKLYHYDHCPYCVKARMVFGFKDAPLELQALANDDENTPIGLVGEKMVPILIRADGKAMGESLEIVEYVDGLADYGPQRVAASHNDGDLNRWLSRARQFHYSLAMPRWVKAGLPEFQTPEAITYFTKKKQLSIGPFPEALEKTPQFIELATAALADLADYRSFENYYWNELSLDDIHLFATLRVLTVVKGLEFPAKIDAYMNRLSKESGVDLHWNRAL